MPTFNELMMVKQMQKKKKTIQPISNVTTSHATNTTEELMQNVVNSVNEMNSDELLEVFIDDLISFLQDFKITHFENA